METQKNNVTNEETGNKFLQTSVTHSTTVTDDPIKSAKSEIKQEREQSKFPTKSKLFDSQVAPDEDHFTWITQMFCDYFKLGPIGFKSNITAWNFPKAIGETKKTHKVKRQYTSRGIMVDVFDKGTKLFEINRIKAHLESIGFSYTYVIGGDALDEKLIFEKRLKKLDPKATDYPKIKVPKDLAQAGFAGFGNTIV
jgi:hypothetical protein